MIFQLIVNYFISQDLDLLYFFHSVFVLISLNAPYVKLYLKYISQNIETKIKF